MTKKDLFGEYEKYGRTQVAGLISSSSMYNTRWQEIAEIGIPKYSVVFLVNVRVHSDFIFFDTMFDNKTLTFKSVTPEEANNNFMIVDLPDTSNLDVVDKWCTDHMGIYGSTVTGQVFLSRKSFNDVIQSKYDDIVWSWGGYKFKKIHLEANKPYVGVAIRRKASTRSFFFQFMDEAGNHFCKEFKASNQKKHENQALNHYFVQIKPNNKIPDPRSTMWRR